MQLIKLWSKFPLGKTKPSPSTYYVYLVICSPKIGGKLPRIEMDFTPIYIAFVLSIYLESNLRVSVNPESFLEVITIALPNSLVLTL